MPPFRPTRPVRREAQKALDWRAELPKSRRAMRRPALPCIDSPNATRRFSATRRRRRRSQAYHVVPASPAKVGMLRGGSEQTMARAARSATALTYSDSRLMPR